MSPLSNEFACLFGDNHIIRINFDLNQCGQTNESLLDQMNLQEASLQSYPCSFVDTCSEHKSSSRAKKLPFWGAMCSIVVQQLETNCAAVLVQKISPYWFSWCRINKNFNFSNFIRVSANFQLNVWCPHRFDSSTHHWISFWSIFTSEIKTELRRVWCEKIKWKFFNGLLPAYIICYFRNSFWYFILALLLISENISWTLSIGFSPFLRH